MKREGGRRRHRFHMLEQCVVDREEIVRVHDPKIDLVFS
jgi:hypothetical protein